MNRVVVLAVSGLLLAACGPVHPGDAAVVDGFAISQKTLDRTAEVYCTVTARSAQAQGQPSVDNAEVRRQAITDLVLRRVADDVLEERGLTVDRAFVDLTPQQLDDIASDFGDDSDRVVEEITKSRELYAAFATIGADETGVTLAEENIDDVSGTGQQVVAAAVADHDVTFSPRLGLSKDGLPTGGIGSLSVLPPSLDEPLADELPDALQCRG